MEHETLYGIDVAHCDICIVCGGTIVSDHNGMAIMVGDTDFNSTVFGHYIQDGTPIRNAQYPVICVTGK